MIEPDLLLYLANQFYEEEPEAFCIKCEWEGLEDNLLPSDSDPDGGRAFCPECGGATEKLL